MQKVQLAHKEEEEDLETGVDQDRRYNNNHTTDYVVSNAVYRDGKVLWEILDLPECLDLPDHCCLHLYVFINMIMWSMLLMVGPVWYTYRL